MKILFNGKEVHLIWEKVYEQIQVPDNSKITIPELIRIINNNTKPGVLLK